MKVALLYCAIFAIFGCVCAKAPGYVLGVEGKCENLACDIMSLTLVKAEAFFPDRLVQITPVVQQPVAMSWERFHAFNKANNTYYFVTSYQPTQGSKPILNLYRIDLGSLQVTTIELDNSELSSLSNIQWDPTTNTLYAAYQNVFATIDVERGTVTKLGAFVDNNWVVRYPSDFDAKTGRYFIAAYNSETDSHHILTYNVHSANTTISGEIGRGSLDVVQIIQYLAFDATDNQLLGLSISRMGTSVIAVECINYSWSSYFDWEEMQQYSAQPTDPVRAGLAVFDAVDSRYYMNLHVSDQAKNGQDGLYYLTVRARQRGIYGAFGLSRDVTNYVFVHN
eukprot:TRINITY_DN13935_c0_g1_i1.p1 TRINITY_DN13935_c0_g1~~TRINITY_DN13935_c0_g1_i1.p1  ORF type:complete len:345 (+),score=52.61 TRINITY_DN13935_c0_g1_i1:26-1036(+)